MFSELMLFSVLWAHVPTDELLAKPGIVLMNPVEQRIVEKTNVERRRHGLAPLQVDGRLVKTARRHTAWMSRSHSLQHGNYGVAENIAAGQQTSTDAVRSWMNSSGHRANILSPGHRKIGVAAYTANNGTVYWCQQFMQ